MPSRPAIFLDRDGVLNRNGPPRSIDEVQVLPGVPDALARFVELDLPLIVVTNQPDVARGTQTRQAVEEINDYLRQRLLLTAIYTCFHDTPDNCNCRKPKPGLLLEAAAAYNIDLGRSFMVGDRWSDVLAGQAAGCMTVLIELPQSQADRCKPDHRARDLPEAAQIILRQLRSRT